MSGVIYYGNQSRLGSVEANTDQGIFGTANPRFLSRVKNPAIPIGYRQDVKKGRACIRSSVSGELKDYEIEIQKSHARFYSGFDAWVWDSGGEYAGTLNLDAK